MPTSSPSAHHIHSQRAPQGLTQGNNLPDDSRKILAKSGLQPYTSLTWRLQQNWTQLNLLLGSISSFRSHILANHLTKNLLLKIRNFILFWHENEHQKIECLLNSRHVYQVNIHSWYAYRNAIHGILQPVILLTSHGLHSDTYLKWKKTFNLHLGNVDYVIDCDAWRLMPSADRWRCRAALVMTHKQGKNWQLDENGGHGH